MHYETKTFLFFLPYLIFLIFFFYVSKMTKKIFSKRQKPAKTIKIFLKEKKNLTMAVIDTENFLKSLDIQIEPGRPTLTYCVLASYIAFLR